MNAATSVFQSLLIAIWALIFVSAVAAAAFTSLIDVETGVTLVVSPSLDFSTARLLNETIIVLVNPSRTLSPFGLV